jgi:flavin-binding protein dodecin
MSGTQQMGVFHRPARPEQERRRNMAESTYKIIELVGTSTKSWEAAAKSAVQTASKSLRDLRIAEISELDMKIEDGKVVAYRARVKVSFKYMGKE